MFMVFELRHSFFISWLSAVLVYLVTVSSL